jgi:nucleoside-diphosphate-sugar epimerase
MSTSRREFLDRSLTLAGALAIPGIVGRSAPAREPELIRAPAPPSSRPLKILFLGGTGFIGPHMVRYAMYRGHAVTLFNRGKTAPDLFPGAETLIGDRDGKLDALKGGKWDAVIDNSGYVPRHVRDSARLLQDSVGRYLFISTGSVYQFDQDEIDEDSPLLPLPEPTSEDVNKYYGPLKVLCEEAVRDAYGPRGTIARLHVVAGPGDPTDRYTYWPLRVDRGGDVIVPGTVSNPIQYIDVRDLAEFVVHLVEQDTAGTYNVAGPTLAETGMAEFVYGLRAVTSAPLAFHWLDQAFLAEQQVRFPLWIPEKGPMRGACHVRSARGVAAGLRFRPMAVTALDTLEWIKSEPAERQAKVGVDPARDARVLAEWRAKAGR